MQSLETKVIASQLIVIRLIFENKNLSTHITQNLGHIIL